MDLADAPADAAFRADLRNWLESATPRLPWPEPTELSGKLPFWRRWRQMLYSADYAGPSWPRNYGGGGMNARTRAILMEELDRARAPERLNIIGEDFAGPTIIDFGTEVQKYRFLDPILKGETIWCQLFSEPEAGPDLASLKTTATRVGGGWSIQLNLCEVKHTCSESLQTSVSTIPSS